MEGDFSDEETLKKAKIDQAKKVLLISNNIEEDAKVLSAVILIRDFNKDIYIIAQIILPKFQVYLQKLHCDEIVLSKEYDSFLLAKSTMYPGLSKVLGELLSEESFYIKHYEKEPRTFKELFWEYLQKNIILLGILENYGKVEELIENVKKESNKVTDIVKHLEHLKQKKTNHVVLYPKDDYLVRRKSGLILMRRRDDRESTV